MNAETESATPAEPDAAVRAEHARSVHRLADAMLSWGLRISLPLSLITLGVSVLVAGTAGLVGGGFGVVLGQGSALVTITMMRMAAQRGPNSLLGFALGGYALKMTALLVVMLLLRDVDGFSRPALAFGMLVVVVAWAAGEVVAFQRTKTPTLVIPPAQSAPTDAESEGSGPADPGAEVGEPAGRGTGDDDAETVDSVPTGRDAADISGTTAAADVPAHTRSGKDN
ncbi:hypothetical protein FB384_003031 [Prauserella sediminis]|uniref:ATP synthase protein I n=1 Tax=Prauserella sediminis TaxID=577680 RepID=A0A839XNB1_9PSEU|nr:hypothetical protein [Prauserella sediminis]